MMIANHATTPNIPNNPRIVNILFDIIMPPDRTNEQNR
jgi:hypothetical protein